jgi:hypothetical protein
MVLSGNSFNSLAAGPASGVSPAEVKQFFDGRDKLVITFVGYSGTGYEDVQEMLDAARNVLAVHSPKKTIVNIGATSAGIGAVYELAKQMGFETTGIVSTQALEHKAEISPHVDTVFYVTDDTWGGFKENTEVLAPTSQAMVQCSDIVIGIGGGDVGRDEMIAARREGKTVKFIPADINHNVAIEAARKKGLPAPADFKGAAFTAFEKPNGSANP